MVNWDYQVNWKIKLALGSACLREHVQTGVTCQIMSHSQSQMTENDANVGSAIP